MEITYQYHSPTEFQKNIYDFYFFSALQFFKSNSDYFPDILKTKIDVLFNNIIQVCVDRNKKMIESICLLSIFYHLKEIKHEFTHQFPDINFNTNSLNKFNINMNRAKMISKELNSKIEIYKDKDVDLKNILSRLHFVRQDYEDIEDLIIVIKNCYEFFAEKYKAMLPQEIINSIRSSTTIIQTNIWQFTNKCSVPYRIISLISKNKGINRQEDKTSEKIILNYELNYYKIISYKFLVYYFTEKYNLIRSALQNYRAFIDMHPKHLKEMIDDKEFIKLLCHSSVFDNKVISIEGKDENPFSAYRIYETKYRQEIGILLKDNKKIIDFLDNYIDTSTLPKDIVIQLASDFYNAKQEFIIKHSHLIPTKEESDRMIAIKNYTSDEQKAVY